MKTVPFPKPRWLDRPGFASTCVIGGQWGDEAKGKIVYKLAEHHNIVMRYNGGPNAGHTLDNITLHQIPSGILYEDKVNIMGQGMVISLGRFNDELKEVEAVLKKEVPYKNLVVSGNAHVILKHEVALDLGSAKKAGNSTGRGIGPTYEQQDARYGIRIGDLDNLGDKKVIDRLRKGVESVNARLPKDDQVPFDEVMKEAEECSERILEYVGDPTEILRNAYLGRKRVLFEGGQGALLDKDKGTYPNVTSSHTTIPHEGQTGYRLPITMALGVLKSPMSRVGVGPFPGEWGECNMEDGSRLPIPEEKALIELKQRIIKEPDRKAKAEMEASLKRGVDVLNAMLLPKILDGNASGSEIGSYFCWKGDEFGATTGRPRRLGPLDLVLARHVADTVGLDGVIFTKWDVYSGTGPVPFIDSYVFDNQDYVDASINYGFLNEWQFANLAEAHAFTRTVPGWDENIQGITDRNALPDVVLNVIKYAQKNIGKPCVYFSTGPKKDDLVVMD